MAHRVCFRITVLWFAMLLFTYFLVSNVNTAVAEQLAFAAPGPYQITGIKTTKSDQGVMLVISRLTTVPSASEAVTVRSSLKPWST